MSSPGRAGPRSRRGFYYQDIFALVRCLEVLAGEWDEVTSEDPEDVTCRKHDAELVEYTQVKTKEWAPQMWSPPELCAPETQGQPSTSAESSLIFLSQRWRIVQLFQVTKIKQSGLCSMPSPRARS
jgi:Cap4 dsDNA endonuclease